MDKGNKYIEMDQNMKENLKKERNRAKDVWIGLINPITSDNGKMINNQVKESDIGMKVLKAENIMDNGKIIICTVMVN